MTGWLAGLWGMAWGKLAGGAVLLAAVAGGLLAWLAGVRRRARDAERARIATEIQARALDERRLADAVEDEVAGLADAERRRRLRGRWARD